MKKPMFVFIIVLVACLLSGEVHAGENINFDPIEAKDIPNLEIDPTKELPEYEIVPKPTPPPQQNEFTTSDNRSWSKSAYKTLIDKAAKDYQVDPQVIYATIMTESEGDKYAFRYEPEIKDASLCLGQVLISTARRLGFEGEPKELYKPEVCIDLIGKYYRLMFNAYGDLTPVQLAKAYNTGSPWKRPVAGHLARFRKWLSE